MNRDESRDRGAEVLPSLHRTPGGVLWTGPLDSDKGGTWFAVNEHGLVACLLNRYQDGISIRPPNPAVSRGHLIPRLMEATSAPKARDRLRSPSFHLSPYPPFTLVLVSPGSGFRLDWRGDQTLEEAVLDEPWDLITSSFFDPETVLPWRKSAFRDWLDRGAVSDQGIPAIHLFCPPGAEALAPLMSRDISCTRSISQARIEPAREICALRYGSVQDGSPDWTQLNDPIPLRADPTMGAETAP